MIRPTWFSILSDIRNISKPELGYYFARAEPKVWEEWLRLCLMNICKIDDRVKSWLWFSGEKLRKSSLKNPPMMRKKMADLSTMWNCLPFFSSFSPFYFSSLTISCFKNVFGFWFENEERKVVIHSFAFLWTFQNPIKYFTLFRMLNRIQKKSGEDMK